MPVWKTRPGPMFSEQVKIVHTFFVHLLKGIKSSSSISEQRLSVRTSPVPHVYDAIRDRTSTSSERQRRRRGDRRGCGAFAVLRRRHRLA
eukprot:scaffold128437_cov27-Tisochrysis_lutea.AAC.1